MAAMIGSNLQFNVAWLEKISFEVDTVIAERGLGFSLGRLEGSPEFFGAVHHPHAATASSCCRLNNEDRKSTRLNSSHVEISYAVFCLKKKKTAEIISLSLNAS